MKKLSKYEKAKRLREIGQGILQARSLKVAVCNPESFWGFKDTNAECYRCGEEVYCNPLFEAAPVKLCVKCFTSEDRLLTT